MLTSPNYLLFKDTVYGNITDIVQTSVCATELAQSLKNIRGLYRTIFLDVCHTKKPRSMVSQGLAPDLHSVVGLPKKLKCIWYPILTIMYWQVASVRQNVINSKTFRVREDFYESMYKESGWTVFGSCNIAVGYEERSLHGKSNGLFGGQLLAALQGACYRKGDSFIKLNDVWTYLQESIRELSQALPEKQHPVLFGEVHPDTVFALVPSK